MTKGIHFTQSFISKIRLPESGRDIYWDSEVLGFGLRVTPAGTMSYFINYRNGDDKQRRKNIARANVTTPKAARNLARQQLDALASGRDPLEKKGAPYLFGELCEEYIKRRVPQMKSGTAEERIIRKDIIPVIGRLAADEVKRKDVRRVAYTIIDERGYGVMANRAQEVVSRIFSFGVDEGLVDRSPAVRLKPVFSEKSRTRYLSESEMRTWWVEVGELDWNSSEALRMILVTGQRPGEVVAMRWDEIEGDWWTVPKERIKARRGSTPVDHRVPLSPLALSILSEIPRLGDYVFPSRRGGKKVDSDTHLSANALDHAAARARRKSELEHWTPHDLRRTCGTNLGRLGFEAYDWIVLNHTPKGITKKVYNLYRYDKEKRLALNTWGDEITRILSGRGADVVPMVR